MQKDGTVPFAPSMRDRDYEEGEESIWELSNGAAEMIHRELCNREHIWVEAAHFHVYDPRPRIQKIVDEEAYHRFALSSFISKENFSGELLLRVDLECTDEQLVFDFKAAVSAKRQANGMTSKRKFKFRQKHAADFQSYCDQKLLPYLHLHAFEIDTKMKLRDADIANALFPDDVEALDKFRKTTKAQCSGSLEFLATPLLLEIKSALFFPVNFLT